MREQGNEPRGEHRREHRGEPRRAPRHAQSREDDAGPGTPARVVGIGSAALLMVGIILVAEPYLVPAAEMPDYPAPTGFQDDARPIAGEAEVFRTRPGDLAPPPGVERRNDAHPRTLAMWRSTRAYPGAPPRIPHGLRPDEFLGTGCNACHERGGWVPRFASYAPVTPHPEYSSCLQCHVPDDVLVGIAFPETGPTTGRDGLCLQCHAPAVDRPPWVELDWRGAAWPEGDPSALPDAPPAIPHDLQLRGNCLACHAGPGAVEEIRTTHPERANCRQCHVSAAGTAEDDTQGFVRPTGGAAAPGGGP